MKHLLKIRYFLLFFAVLLLFCTVNSFMVAKAETADTKDTGDTVYAYLPKDTMMYGITSGGLYEIVILPKTYFVAIISDASLPESSPPTVPSVDVTNGYHLVNYLNLTGYVKKTDVEIVDYEPVTKYAVYTLSPDNDGLGANLREKPKKDSSIMLSIPAETTVSYYGYLNGDPLISQLGGKWFFVKFSKDNKASFGYVYSGHVLAQDIPPNKIEKVEKPKPPKSDPAPVTIPQPLAIIFIVCLSLPAGGVMLLLFKKKPSEKVPRNSDNHF